MIDEEEWRPVDEFPHYMVSSHGRVRHLDRREPRNISVNEKGFPVILLSSATSPTRYMRQINVLVARAFLAPPIEDDMTAVWHKDGNLINCHADNLMWETRGRVLEWNEMNRLGHARWSTPEVRNNRTGMVYRNAFECAMAEGRLESEIINRIEKYALSPYDDNARYRYMTEIG